MVLYTSAFYLVGLAISARLRQSATALVACIAVWAGCTIVAPTATAYVVGEVVPLPPERDLKAHSDEINRRLTEECWNGFYETAYAYGRQQGKDYSLFGRSAIYGPVSVGGFAGVFGLFEDAAPMVTDYYGRYEPRQIAAGRDIAEMEYRLVQA